MWAVWVALLLAAGTARADLSAAKHGKRRPGELREHVPNAPEEPNAVRSPMQAIRRCYERELTRARPDLAGKLVLRMTIAEGRVAKVEINFTPL
jgi:hypothetical protein